MISGVNRQTTNIMSLNTKPGWSLKDNHDYTGHIWRTNCDQPDNAGCNFGTDDTQNYSGGFNAIRGDVYAME